MYIQEHPEPSIIGIVIAVVSIVVMPVLFCSKYKLGKSIGSRSLVADSKETLACSLRCVGWLVGLGVYYIWQIWWGDAVAALGIAGFMIKEGYETFSEPNRGTRRIRWRLLSSLNQKATATPQKRFCPYIRFSWL